MTHTGSITQWISGLRTGDELAAQQVWQRYVDRLATLARGRLRKQVRRVSDEEDVVLSALEGFFRGARQGRFTKLEDRDDLWQVLVMVVERKAVDHARREMAEKRGGGRVVHHSGLQVAGESNSGFPMDQVGAPEPTPELAAQVVDELQVLMDRLGDQLLQQVAGFKLEGYTNQEIADKLDIGLRSVERKLWLIRECWQEEQAG